MVPHKNRNSGKVVFGLIVLLVGFALLVKKLGLLPQLNFHITWPVILIIVGLLIGVRHQFRNASSWILIAVGVFNLIPAFSFSFAGRIIDSEDLAIPLLLILVGLLFIIRPRGRQKSLHFDEHLGAEDLVQIRSFFGGKKSIITSKNFRGGSIAATFGGSEINLMQADSPLREISLEVHVFCGGCTILLPADWKVVNDIEPVMGSVEDHRNVGLQVAPENQKILLLQGSAVLGGVEIKSF